MVYLLYDHNVVYMILYKWSLSSFVIFDNPYLRSGGTLCVTVIIVEKIGVPSSNPGWNWCVSLYANAQGKGMNQSIHPPSTCKK